MKSNKIQMLDYLQGKTVAIMAYDEDGRDHARVLKEHGIKVIIGLREDGNRQKWISEGFEVKSIWEAIDQATVIQVW